MNIEFAQAGKEISMSKEKTENSEEENLMEEPLRSQRLAEMDSRLNVLQNRRAKIQEAVLSSWMSLDDLRILNDYMENEFLDDYDAGQPDGQKPYTSGLLSQDALYDEIQEYYFLAKDMESAAKDMLKAIGASPEDDPEKIDEDLMMSGYADGHDLRSST